MCRLRVQFAKYICIFFSHHLSIKMWFPHDTVMWEYSGKYIVLCTQTNKHGTKTEVEPHSFILSLPMAIT